EPQLGIADVKGVVERGEGDSRVKAAERGQSCYRARSINSIDLTCLPPGPKAAVAVERDAFGVIEGRSENLKQRRLAHSVRGGVRIIQHRSSMRAVANTRRPSL